MPKRRNREKIILSLTHVFNPIEFGVLLAPFLTTKEATMLRSVDRACLSLVRGHAWRDKSTVVANLDKWRACFPRSTALKLSTRSMKKSREYVALKGVKDLTVILHENIPTRFLRYIDSLVDLNIEEFVPFNERPFIYLPTYLSSFHAKLADPCMFYLQFVECFVSIPRSPVSDESFRWLNPNLQGLNISGCDRLTDRCFRFLPCASLVSINVSYTNLSDEAFRTCPNVQNMVLVVFGFNSFITDRVLSYFTGLKELYIHKLGSPFTVAAVAELQRRGVVVREIP
jgi:hypothetical protein